MNSNINLTIGKPTQYTLLPETAVLVGIDFQRGFGPNSWEHVPNAEEAVDRFRVLAQAWRRAGGQVIFVHTTYYPEDEILANKAEKLPSSHHALAAGSFGASFYPDLVESSDVTVRKIGFSAVTGGDLLQALTKTRRDAVILGGLTTPYCVQTTADDLSSAGFRVAVLSDASASQAIGNYSPAVAHDFTLQRISYLIGQVINSNEIIANL